MCHEEAKLKNIKTEKHKVKLINYEYNTNSSLSFYLA